MQIKLPYTKTQSLTLSLPESLCDTRLLDIHDELPPLADAEIADILGTVARIPAGFESILLVVSDITRKTGVHRVLPVLFKLWQTYGIREQQVSFLFATGAHRDPSPAEIEYILGSDIAKRFAGRIFINQALDAGSFDVYKTTSRGTPVRMSKLLRQFDRIFLTGSVKFHYFAGFGGGRKSLLPGVAHLETIISNHSKSLDHDRGDLADGVEIGRLSGNPVAEDMREAAGMVAVDAVINGVVNKKGQVISLYAGGLDEAFLAGVEKARQVYLLDIDKRADLVIGAGQGYKNMLQTHKVLYNCHQAMKPDGYKLVLSPCVDGIGSDSYREWMLHPMEELLQRHKNAPKAPDLNAQTAVSTRRKAANTYLYSNIDKQTTELFGMQKVTDLQHGVESLLRTISATGRKPLVYIMKQAGETVVKAPA